MRNMCLTIIVTTARNNVALKRLNQIKSSVAIFSIMKSDSNSVLQRVVATEELKFNNKEYITREALTVSTSNTAFFAHSFASALYLAS